MGNNNNKNKNNSTDEKKDKTQAQTVENQQTDAPAATAGRWRLSACR